MYFYRLSRGEYESRGELLLMHETQFTRIEWWDMVATAVDALRVCPLCEGTGIARGCSCEPPCECSCNYGDGEMSLKDLAKHMCKEYGFAQVEVALEVHFSGRGGKNGRDDMDVCAQYVSGRDNTISVEARSELELLRRNPPAITCDKCGGSVRVVQIDDYGNGVGTCRPCDKFVTAKVTPNASR